MAKIIIHTFTFVTDSKKIHNSFYVGYLHYSTVLKIEIITIRIIYTMNLSSLKSIYYIYLYLVFI